MTSPKPDYWMKVLKIFEELWNFFNYLRAISRKRTRTHTHTYRYIISIQYPPNFNSKYYNYKGFHSIVLQAVINANAKFIANW